MYYLYLVPEISIVLWKLQWCPVGQLFTLWIYVGCQGILLRLLTAHMNPVLVPSFVFFVVYCIGKFWSSIFVLSFIVRIFYLDVLRIQILLFYSFLVAIQIFIHDFVWALI